MWEAEIRRTVVPGQPGEKKKVCKTLSQCKQAGHGGMLVMARSVKKEVCSSG
jgi:hypothetical protein